MSTDDSFPTESAEPLASGLRPGAILGGFKLVARIGVGGMGEVWRAQNAKIERMVRAIKVIRTDLSVDGNFAARFLREAEYLEELQHPNILRVENLGED